MILKKINNKIRHHQKQFAERLSKQEQKLSPQKKKWLLVFFCILLTLACLYVIGKSLFWRRPDAVQFQTTPVSIPYHIGKNFHLQDARIDEGTFNKVEHFKMYLDSLKIKNSGRYTEIMNTRPHLTDSILAFEKLYFTQHK